MNDARQAFGLTLQTRREHLGITLHDIAESTKISVALLSGLERGDVSRWPKGIFRRSFFREYAVALGLSPESLLSDFVRLFPDEPAAAAAAAAPRANELRLELAARNSLAGAALKRMAMVVGELAAISLIGTAGAWVLPVETLPAIGLTALAYYPVSNLFVARKLAIPSLRVLVKSTLPSVAEPRRHEEIEGHEDLQISVVGTS